MTSISATFEVCFDDKQRSEISRCVDSFSDATIYVCVCVCVCVCMYVCMYMSVCADMYVYVSVCADVCMYVYVYVCADVCVCVCVCLYVQTCVCMSLYVQMCVYVSVCADMCVYVCMHIKLFPMDRTSNSRQPCIIAGNPYSLCQATATSSMSVYPSISSYRTKNSSVIAMSDDAAPYGQAMHAFKLQV